MRMTTMDIPFTNLLMEDTPTLFTEGAMATGIWISMMFQKTMMALLTIPYHQPITHGTLHGKQESICSETQFTYLTQLIAAQLLESTSIHPNTTNILSISLLRIDTPTLFTEGAMATGIWTSMMFQKTMTALLIILKRHQPITHGR